MKSRIILIIFGFCLASSFGFAQKNKAPKSIISENVGIKKYHSKGDLERMHKGELLGLYTERIKSLVKTLPYIAFATKPGVTMSTLGVPNNNDNRKVLDGQFEATDDYVEATISFQNKMLPYSDTSDLVAAIIFYEEIMKSLHEYSEFH